MSYNVFEGCVNTMKRNFECCMKIMKNVVITIKIRNIMIFFLTRAMSQLRRSINVHANTIANT